MAKRKPYNQLTIGFQSRPVQLSEFNIKDNTGLDTETYKGYVRLIADDKGNYKEIESITEILQFMTSSRYRTSFNWFYNIRYDFESIVKYLDKDLLLELYNEGTVKYEHYKLTFFAGKLFSINHDKHSYVFYDLFNFLETSLDRASKTYLGLEKLKEVDANKLNTDLDYWLEHKDNIIKYCKYDAYLTKLLADYFWQTIYKTINFYPKRPISKGKLSEEYFLNTCYIPIIKDIPFGVLEMAYKNYVGGRFELLKKGYFPMVYVYDIKSAYPYQMTKLIDYSNGIWKKVKQFNDDADYGFYHCSVSSLEPFFSPFCVKKNGLNIYPVGKFFQFLNSDEIRFIKKYYKHTKITVLSGYEFTMHLETFPFKEEIEKLYAWKEREKDEAIKYCVKIILNSLYGKTIQTVGDRTGKLFNPIYATKITSNTRLALQELALQSPENIIQFSTDSVSSKVPLKVPDKPKLGEFSFEFSGHGIYAISDIYSLWNLNNNKVKDKFRGFNKVKDTVFNIFESLNLDTPNKTLIDILKTMKFNTKYEYSKERPYHMGECLLHTDTREKEDINIFHTEKKIIDINSDAKRYWLREFKNGQDCMTNNINSYPLKFG
jgi:hypothetical protein